MKKKQQSKKTWAYPDSFKLKAFKLSQQDGIPVKDVAAMLEVHPGMLSKWRKDFKDGKIVDDGSVSPSEIKEEKKEFDRIAILEKENHRLKQENKLLKKYQRFLGERHQKNIDLSRGTKSLCQGLQVCPSGYYAWLKRLPPLRKHEDNLLLKKIQEIFKANREVYGSPRIHKALRDQGIFVGKKRVERLMQEHRLQARSFKVTNRHPGLKKFGASGENLRRKVAGPTGMDQQWVADVTYLKAGEKWHYLAVIMDIYSRKVLGWALKTNRTFDLTSAALKNALKNRSPSEGMIFHTDRGIEFRNLNFQKLLKRNGMKASVNRPGRCTDNAHMESFFHTLKTELIRGRGYRSGLELRSSLNSYINQFYNHKRMHSGIGYLPPAVFEQIQ